MLVLLLLGASVFSAVLQSFLPLVLYQWTNLASRLPSSIVSLSYQLFYFPFSLTMVLWLTSRSGRTTWSTWYVPISMLILISAFPAVGMLLPTGNCVIKWSIVDIMLVWQSALRPNIISFVLMVFAFRAATLYLRPAEALASAHRLSITTILLLTTTVAVTLSFDALATQFALAQEVEIVQLPSSQRFIELVMFVFPKFSTVLLWFSVAWLFVSRNPRRWIGVLGLFIHFAISGLMDLLVFPMYWDQVQPLWGTKPQLAFWYFVGSFAVNIFHDLIVFLCFGIIHVAGYRWDIWRPSLTSDDALDTKGTIPPVLATPRITCR